MLQVATDAFQAVLTFPVGSKTRDAHWDRFDAAMAEPAARGMRHILTRLREQGEPADGRAIPGDEGAC